MTHRVKHDNELAEAAKLESTQHLKRMAVHLARRLDIELPTYEGLVEISEG